MCSYPHFDHELTSEQAGRQAGRQEGRASVENLCLLLRQCQLFIAILAVPRETQEENLTTLYITMASTNHKLPPTGALGILSEVKLMSSDAAVFVVQHAVECTISCLHQSVVI